MASFPPRDGTTSRIGMSKDDAILLKSRADEYRAGYRNWRQQGVKGAHGELADIKPVESGPNTGANGFASGYNNWRRGKAKGSIEGSQRIESNTITRHDPAEDRASTMGCDAEAASVAAVKGENWLKFFLHPDSEYHRTTTGGEKIPLRAQNLPQIAKIRRSQLKEDDDDTRDRGLPTYARALSSFDHVICHMGVGGFHRSHEAMYTDLLLRLGKEGARWAIVGLGLMPWDGKMKEVLEAQDHMYTLLSRGRKGTAGRVIGSIVDFVHGPDDRAAVLERIADPTTCIISLTITEKGYCLGVDGRLDPANSLIAHDRESPESPHSAVGHIVAGLRLRRDRGIPGLTVLSCDNMPENGDTAKRMVMDFLDMLDDAPLTAWINENVTFPNTMVDRITPRTEDEHRTLVTESLGIVDDWPVVAEDFTQWVIEDKFVCGRPAWDDLDDVIVVKDVVPYEMMKLRFLNAGHSALSYAAYLMGYRFVDVAMGDPAVESFIRAYFAEVNETVPILEGVDKTNYLDTLIQRFSNPYIKDTLARLAQDGSQKLVTTMRDAALENIHAGRPTTFFSFVVATWIRYLVGFDPNGEDITIEDPRESELCPQARLILEADMENRQVSPPTELPRTFVSMVFGEELASNTQVLQQIFDELTAITNGTVSDRLNKVLSL